MLRWWIEIQVQNKALILCPYNSPVWITLLILSAFYFKLENPAFKILAVYNSDQKIEVWIVYFSFMTSLSYKGIYYTLRIYAKRIAHSLKIIFTVAYF